MLILLSPAKTLDFDSNSNCKEFTQPDFLSLSKTLIEHLRKLSSEEICKLMHISPKLSELNKNRYTNWSESHSLDNTCKQAILAFNYVMPDLIKGEKENILLTKAMQNA